MEPRPPKPAKTTGGDLRTNAAASPAPERPLANTYWVIPGRFLAGEYPGGADDDATRRRLASVRAAGIDAFVDLTEEQELAPYRHLLPDHIEYVRSAIVDASVPNNVVQTRELIDRLHSALARGRCLYLHCRAGVGRTGLIVGCFLADAGPDGKKALKHLNQLWRQSERSEAWRKVPQTAEQADYVRRWRRLAERPLSVSNPSPDDHGTLPRSPLVARARLPRRV